MQTRTISQKLKSMKLWTCLIGVILGAVLYLGADADAIKVIAGAALQLISTVTFIITEGKVDAEAVAHTVQIVGEAISVLGAEDGEED